MRRVFNLLIVFVVLATISSSCSKKKKNSAVDSAPAPHPASPLPPPPPIDPHNPDPGNVGYALCGVTYDNFVSPSSVQSYYDPQYDLDWYQVDQYATYWFAGQWYWYGQDCYEFQNWAYYSWSYYYTIYMQPTPCYTCTCYTCGNYPPAPRPTPTPQPHPQPTPDPYPSCGGYTQAMSTKSYSTTTILDHARAAYVKSTSLPEYQSYYIVFKANYTGVGPGGAQKTDETVRLRIDGTTRANIKDLNTTSSNSGLQNSYSESCYVKLCLEDGPHEFRFEGTGTSVEMKGFEIRTSKPSLPSCN